MLLLYKHTLKMSVYYYLSVFYNYLFEVYCSFYDGFWAR
jgi:hypothetical protein